MDDAPGLTLSEFLADSGEELTGSYDSDDYSDDLYDYPAYHRRESPYQSEQSEMCRQFSQSGRFWQNDARLSSLRRCQSCFAYQTDDGVCQNCELIKRYEEGREEAKKIREEAEKKKSESSEAYLKICKTEYADVTKARKMMINAIKLIKERPDEAIMTLKLLTSDLTELHESLLRS